MKNFKVAVCQMMPSDDKKVNIEKAYKMICESASNGASVVVFGEMFNCPYNSKYFAKFAETIPDGDTYKMLQNAAVENSVYIIGGSMPELCDDVVYNTSFSFNPKGELIGKYRKMHLFDVDLESGIRFKESDSIGRGNEVTVFDTEYCKMGVAICYDIRFPELMRLMALEGAEVIVVPAAFNTVTGPAHWELLFKARAVDNQVFMIGASPARDTDAKYAVYGNSIIVNPWAEVADRAAEGEEIIYAELDGSMIEKVRKELPLLKHIRTDLYEIIKK